MLLQPSYTTKNGVGARAYKWPLSAKLFRASVFSMKKEGAFHSWHKTLSQLVLLAFAVVTFGGLFATDSSTPQLRVKVCSQVKVGTETPSAGPANPDQLFHVGAVLFAQVLTVLRTSFISQTPQSVVARLLPATPCRAPPGYVLS